MGPKNLEDLSDYLATYRGENRDGLPLNLQYVRILAQAAAESRPIFPGLIYLARFSHCGPRSVSSGLTPPFRMVHFLLDKTSFLGYT